LEKQRTGFLLEFTPNLFRCRNDERTRERELRLLVGATLCGRPNTENQEDINNQQTATDNQQMKQIPCVPLL
jgi:hypothetical protein